tara:strand:- start:47 stop:256 length:210 start_codon:yes stop_codon:yes gene_type:complete
MKKFLITLENPQGSYVDMSAEEIQQREEDSKTPKPTSVDEIVNLKDSAKTKLINGEALTEDEANVMVGL